MNQGIRRRLWVPEDAKLAQRVADIVSQEPQRCGGWLSCCSTSFATTVATKLTAFASTAANVVTVLPTNLTACASATLVVFSLWRTRVTALTESRCVQSRVLPTCKHASKTCATFKGWLLSRNRMHGHG